MSTTVREVPCGRRLRMNPSCVSPAVTGSCGSRERGVDDSVSADEVSEASEHLPILLLTSSILAIEIGVPPLKRTRVQARKWL